MIGLRRRLLGRLLLVLLFAVIATVTLNMRVAANPTVDYGTKEITGRLREQLASRALSYAREYRVGGRMQVVLVRELTEEYIARLGLCHDRDLRSQDGRWALVVVKGNFGASNMLGIMLSGELQRQLRYRYVGFVLDARSGQHAGVEFAWPNDQPLRDLLREGEALKSPFPPRGSCES